MRREEGGGAGRESERAVCLGATSGGGLCFSFVSPGVRKKGGGIRGREWICVVIHGRIGGRLRYDLYTLLSLPLVSEPYIAVKKKRTKNFPHP